MRDEKSCAIFKMCINLSENCHISFFSGLGTWVILMCIWASESSASLLRRAPRLPFTLAWEKLNKQEVRRPGTSCLPQNGPLVPSSSSRGRQLLLEPMVPLEPAQSLQVQCFGSEFHLSLFLPTTSEHIQTQWSHYPLTNWATKQLEYIIFYLMASSVAGGHLLPHTDTPTSLHGFFWFLSPHPQQRALRSGRQR